MPRRARHTALALCYVTIAAALRPSPKTRPRTRLQAVASKDVEPLLLCKDIEAKVVENDKAILKGLDLEVRPGEVHAIMGPNGSGKSTLSKVLARHPAYEATNGIATLEGEDLLEVCQARVCDSHLLSLARRSLLSAAPCCVINRARSEAARGDDVLDAARRGNVDRVLG